MKVKELAEFLKKCDQEAEISMSSNGHYYSKLAIVQQGYRDLNSNYVTHYSSPQLTNNLAHLARIVPLCIYLIIL